MVDGGSITGKGGGKCLVGPYDEIKDECSKRTPPHEAHHIVPDFALRTGTRKDAKVEAKRISKKMPTLGQGPAICLPGEDGKGGQTLPNLHLKAHQGTDGAIKGLGRKKRTGTSARKFPAGTAPLKEVKQTSVAGAKSAAPHCGEKIKKAVEKAFPESLDDTPCRTTKHLPKGDAKKSLSNFKDAVSKTRRK